MNPLVIPFFIAAAAQVVIPATPETKKCDVQQPVVHLPKHHKMPMHKGHVKPHR